MISFFPIYGNLIIPTDELNSIFQRGRWLNHQAVMKHVGFVWVYGGGTGWTLKKKLRNSGFNQQRW